MKKIILLLFIIIESLIFGEIFQKELFQSDTTITGINENKISYFFIEPNWKILKDPEIKIELIASQLTLENSSSITFLINGNPVKSYKILKDENNEKKLVVSFFIPKKYIKIGANEFIINKFQRLTEVCKLDEINPANWLKINASNISIEYKKNDENLNLSMLPMPILNLYPTEDERVVKIGVNKKITSKDKVELANLALNIGSISKNNFGKIEIKTIDKLLKMKGSYIIVSEFEKLPQEIKNSFSEYEMKKLDKGTALKLIENPNDNLSKILIYTSKKNIYGNNKDQLLVKEDLKYLNTDFVIIPKRSHKKIKKETITLNSLGIEDLQFMKIGKSSQIFALELPKGKIINSLNLNLKYFASKLINSNNSTLGISINGRKIKDTVIKSDGIKNQIKLIIPKSELSGDKIYIEIFTNLISQKDCYISPMPWLTILGESEIYFETKNKKTFSINDFPALFIENESLKKIGISVSSDLNSLSFLFEIFEKIGRNIKNSSKIFYIESEKDLNEIENALIIGSPLTNKILKSKKNQLFLKYNNLETGFENNKNVEFLVEDNIYTGMQLFKNHMYIFTDKNVYYENVLRKLLNGEIKGDAYLATDLNKGKEFNINIKEGNDIEENFYYGRIKIGFSILISVLIIFIVLILYFRKKIDR